MGWGDKIPAGRVKFDAGPVVVKITGEPRRETVEFDDGPSVVTKCDVRDQNGALMEMRVPDRLMRAIRGVVGERDPGRIWLKIERFGSGYSTDFRCYDVTAKMEQWLQNRDAGRQTMLPETETEPTGDDDSPF